MVRAASFAFVMSLLCVGCVADTTADEAETLLLGGWSVDFDPGECADATAATGADFTLQPFEDGGTPLVILVVRLEDVGSAGFELGVDAGRVRYERAYDGDVFDLELADDGTEATVLVRYTHARECTVEVEASAVRRMRLGVD